MADSMAKLELEPSSDFGSQYDVFLSFRGEDTRKNFTDHLYEALVRSGFRTFRDDDEIKRGEVIRLELERGIQKSLVYIVIFSKTYASSKWCLEELVMITSAGGRHVVLPIFYDVDVEQLKIWRKGNFEETLKGAADNTVDDQKLNLWREALRMTSKLSGLVLQNEADRHEAKFIKKIVQEVGNKLKRRLLSVPDQIIGMDSTVEQISSILNDKSKSAAGVILICGMAGIGKTTLAYVVYNMHYRMFEDHTILPDIHNLAKERRDLVELQKQLLANITGRQESISCLEEGIVKIQCAMCSKRVLIVLDDVNHEKHLNAAFGSITKLTRNGSKIIITTKNQGLLKIEGEASYYKIKVPLLGWKDALELFSWHAFKKNHTMEDYLRLSKKVFNCSGRLPLALKVFGSSLFGQPVMFWKKMLQKLEAVPDTEVMEKLQISFECLQDKDDRELFLDIACFFVGRRKDFATRILDGCGFYTEIGIRNLIDRSLLTIDDNDRLSMHQLIQDLGRKIVFEQSCREPGNRSRLWDHKTSFDVLREKTGTKEIEGMILDMHMLKDDYFTMMALETEAFEEMRNLRLLQINHVKISGNFDGFPKRLRWLCCHGFPLHSLPNDFPIEKMVVLEMQHSNLKQLWGENKFASKLEILDLSHSRELRKTPDFSRLVHLQILILEECPNLIEIHESIGKLNRLITINLKNCISLKKLPKEIGMVNNLETLIISGCSSLKEWPNEIGEMKSLKELFVDGVGIGDVQTISWHSRIINWALSKWEYKSNKEIVSSISFPSTLVHLSLEGCNLVDNAFASVNSISLSQLRELNLSRNMISYLPEVVKSCVGLKALYMEQCPNLKSIVGLQNVGIQNVGSSSRYYLECRGCPKLVKIETCFILEPINNNDVELLGKWGFCNLESIVNTKIRYCNFLSSLRTWKYTPDRLLQSHSGGHITKELPLQRLYNYNGVYNYFFPGIEIPSGFFRSRRKIEEIKKDSMLESYGGIRRRLGRRSQREPLQVSLVVQKCGDGMKRLPGLIICFVYNGISELICDIENRTKHLRWRHRPHYVGVARNSEEDMVWVSHWNFGNNSHHLVDYGDVIRVKVEERGSVKELAVGLNTFESTTPSIDSFLYETAIPVGKIYKKRDYSGGIDFRGHM